MNKIPSLIILGSQIGLTFVSTFCTYVLFALLDTEMGFEGYVSVLIFQPIIAFILSALTIIICLIIGLPIRLNKKLKLWWISNFYIALVGTVLGMLLLGLSLLPSFLEKVTFEQNAVQTVKQIPNGILSISGWFIMAFSLLHTYPPPIVTRRFKALFQ